MYMVCTMEESEVDLNIKLLKFYFARTSILEVPTWSKISRSMHMLGPQNRADIS